MQYRKLYSVTFKTPRGSSYASHLLLSDIRLSESNIKSIRPSAYDYKISAIDEKEEK